MLLQVPLNCGGLDGQITQTHEAQGLGRNAFRCDFIGDSHSHSNERKKKKRAKKKEKEKEEVEGENIATVVRK